MSQIDADAWMSEPLFFGEGYDKQLDFTRLRGNLKKVHDVMVERMNQRKTTSLRKLSELTGVPEASASACLRTMRNQGGFVIEKRRSTVNAGTWVYWIAGGGMGKHSRKPKKLKPIGNPELFGEMMRCIYVMGKSQEPGHHTDMAMSAFAQWASDLAREIRKADQA